MQVLHAVASEKARTRLSDRYCRVFGGEAKTCASVELATWSWHREASNVEYFVVTTMSPPAHEILAAGQRVG